MIREISKTNQLTSKITKEGAVRFDDSKDLRVVLEMNKELEDFRRDYRIKDKKSHVSAASVILTA